MNGFDLSTISSVYVGSTQYSQIYIGSDKIWPAQTFVQYDCEIEYLEGTGNQYIDLNIIPNENTGIYIQSIDNNQSGAYDHYACGLRDGSGDTRWCIGHSQLRWYYGYGGYATIADGPYSGYIAESTLNYLNSKTATCVVNGSTFTVNLPSLSFTPQYNIRIFGSSGVSAEYAKWNGKIYAFKVSQGSTVVMDLIPVRVGQVGYMYDTVSGKLLGNSGTGDFVLGPDKQ